MTEGKRPVCVVGKAKLKVDRNKYFQKNPRWLCGMTVSVFVFGVKSLLVLGSNQIFA
jgi:hypothetical protein